MFVKIPSEIIVAAKTQQAERRWFFDRTLTKDQIRLRLVRLMFETRLLVIVVQMLFNGWDFGTDAFRGIPIDGDNKTIVDVTVHRLLRGLHRWDSIHMIHIAQWGYVYETSLAFFPLFPLVVRLTSMCWASPFLVLGLFHPVTAHLISAVVLNFIFAIASAFILYELVLALTRSTKRAILATIIYSINPASVFFTAAYTEALYALLTWTGLVCLVSQRGSFIVKYPVAVLCFALALLARSNGLLNVCYVAFYMGVVLFLRREPSTKLNWDRVSIPRNLGYYIANTVALSLMVLCTLVVMIFPVQIYGEWQRAQFCSVGGVTSPLAATNGRDKNLVMAGDLEKLQWCRNEGWLMPPFYSWIQEHYWQVSFLGYWQIQKLPCFLLALPTIIIVLLGVQQLKTTITTKGLWWLLASGGGMLPYTLHAVALTVGAVFFYNTEVSDFYDQENRCTMALDCGSTLRCWGRHRMVLTRMIFSSSPFAYIVLARWIDERTPQVRLSDLFAAPPIPFLPYFFLRGFWEKTLYLYLLGYTVMGTACHSMFLPFT